MFPLCTVKSFTDKFNLFSRKNTVLFQIFLSWWNVLTDDFTKFFVSWLLPEWIFVVVFIFTGKCCFHGSLQSSVFFGDIGDITKFSLMLWYLNDDALAFSRFFYDYISTFSRNFLCFGCFGLWRGVLFLFWFLIAHPDWVKLRVLSLCLLTKSKFKVKKRLAYWAL